MNIMHRCTDLSHIAIYRSMEGIHTSQEIVPVASPVEQWPGSPLGRETEKKQSHTNVT